MTMQNIDTNTEIWSKRIIEASKQAIPLTSYITRPEYRTSHQSRLLQIQYDAVKYDIETLGSSLEKYQRLVTSTQELQAEYRRLYAESCNRLIQKLDVENNSKIFWTSIKKLQRTGEKIKATYIKERQNRHIGY